MYALITANPFFLRRGYPFSAGRTEQVVTGDGFERYSPHRWHSKASGCPCCSSLFVREVGGDVDVDPVATTGVLFRG
jgi:hypothetical protein